MLKDRKTWHAMECDAVMAELDTDANGLTVENAAIRLQEFGSNTLETGRMVSPWIIFLRQFNNPIGWLLIVSGSLALVLGKNTDAAVVFGAVVINSIIGYLQEYKAGKAIASLGAMVPESATVVRAGDQHTVSVDQLVPGDMVLLQSGDKVPADLRLLRIKNLTLEEAPLTGESIPAVKKTDAVPHDAPVGDRFGMAYSGTLVVQGTGAGIVVETGSGTELGRINTLLNQTKSLETPLTRQLARVSTGITIAVVAVVALLVVFGIWIKNATITDALMVAVSLAVAAIPEGLPAVITISLAIGVRRMASRHAIVRHLPAVETLGSTSVICTDKTGTLTRNEMTVQVAWLQGHEYRFSGIGYNPDGEIEHDGLKIRELPPELKDLLHSIILCNDASLNPDGEEWRIVGDPTEAALVVAGKKGGVDEAQLRKDHPRLDVMPFESETKFMATLNSFPEGSRILLKGAPENVLPRCSLAETVQEQVQAAVDTYARQGLRVIACACLASVDSEHIHMGMLDGGLDFTGLVCMMDPPRTEAMDALRICHEAGITVKMITGDHPLTAEAIGRQLGLLGKDQAPLTGIDLDRMTESEFRAAVNSTGVFARVAPEHKIKLVQALQAQKQVVAMTGDGVNDAPALKQADIGVAMGITGTAVAREAAKVVLMDDNFASIAAAVEEGRRVYDNLIKSLAFILPTNLGLACILSVSMFFFPNVIVDGVPMLLLAMSPTQTLWINLIASITLSVPLAFEVLEPNTMGRPPRSPGEPIFTVFMIFRLVLVAVIMTAGSCGLFLWEYFSIVGDAALTSSLHTRALAEAQTICVTTITFTQCFYLINCRSLRDSFMKLGVLTNPAVFVGIGILLLLQTCFMYLPILQLLFASAALDGQALLKSFLVGSLVLPIIMIEQWLVRRKTSTNP